MVARASVASGAGMGPAGRRAAWADRAPQSPIMIISTRPAAAAGPNGHTNGCNGRCLRGSVAPAASWRADGRMGRHGRTAAVVAAAGSRRFLGCGATRHVPSRRARTAGREGKPAAPLRAGRAQWESTPATGAGGREREPSGSREGWIWVHGMGAVSATTAGITLTTVHRSRREED
jgi:hypothetical protein